MLGFTTRKFSFSKIGKAVSFIFWKYPYFFALCPPFFKLWLANLFLSLFYSIDVWSCVASIQLLIIYIHICIGNVCNFLKISYFTLWAFWSGLNLMSFQGGGVVFAENFLDFCELCRKKKINSTSAFSPNLGHWAYHRYQAELMIKRKTFLE